MENQCVQILWYILETHKEINKIAIEIKKERNNKYDIEKLKILTASNGLYRYDLGVFINFPNSEAKYKWFVDGKEELL